MTERVALLTLSHAVLQVERQLATLARNATTPPDVTAAWETLSASARLAALLIRGDTTRRMIRRATTTLVALDGTDTDTNDEAEP